MSLSVGELKKVSVQSIRDIAAGLRAKATSMRATKTGVTDLPHKGTWTGIAADNADHEIGTFGKGLGTDADAYENAAAKVDRAGDEFEGLKQLLTKLENEAAGKFSINEATGEVTPLSKDFNKADRDYIANTLKQLCAAGGQANDDLAAGIHATDTSGTTTPAYATGALPTSPNSAVKPDGVFGGVQNLATANPDGEPGATRAAAAAGADTQANYKEWYPKTPGSGDKLTIDPSKAGSFTGTVGALEKLPGAPKPADGFGSGVARQFGQGVNSRVDGLIDEAKNLTGQGGPGSPGVAESWAKFALGTADQMANPLGSLPGEVKEAVNDPAGFAGKKLFDVSSIAATGPLGGEAAAGARGLLGDLTGAETRALTHDIPDTHHGPAPLDHPSPHVDHTPTGSDHHAPAVSDHNGGSGGDHSIPGDSPPHFAPLPDTGPYQLPERAQLATPSDGAFFWSGRNAGGTGIGPISAGGNGAADLIADGSRATTLEGLLDSQGIKPPKWSPTDDYAQKWWDGTSQMYAESASGEVRAVIGSNLRPGNVWQTVELPRLMDNPHVNRIVVIDPDTGIETTVFQR
ncbi:Hypothetical protein ERS075662_02990 [Mycobacteroides abscessus]|uniref:endonuclease n=1 Tax=Mycobacteroides abscessus TaxID=36809 RepID=UPI0005E5B0B2|nr:endonuclease [Mycobacteroides abscessus]CPW03017.1 Hypothetical protein ERS075584_03367 [Mycobacteroides abscessus]CPW65960.1 Hypothetical protein ERS075595_01933 [Mycobacteroides abscessus]CPW98792.1 Hypothetical protein ERS075598_03422 [Mycobacteroides abscessus]CPX46292.1 Hypothetical protein ERS075607_02979 [Mycobacteroides abscessus]CPX50030.1 Hypothetical protein ERS075615_01156 [Mycobacteroides abscessus]